VFQSLESPSNGSEFKAFFRDEMRLPQAAQCKPKVSDRGEVRKSSMSADNGATMQGGTLIVGGGIVGLGIGWKLALRGEPVTVIERGEAAREATWAAAGMLAPATEVHFQEDRNLELGLESMRLYGQFVADLEGYTGMSVDYQTDGALAVASTADEAADLKDLFDYQQARNLPVRWLSGEAVRELEPGLSSYVTAGVQCGMDHQVDPRLLGAALKAAFVKAGGVLLENTPVTDLRLGDGVLRGVTAGGRDFTPARLVIAAGAWSGLLPGLPERVRPPVRPVKGQLVAVRRPKPSFLQHIIRAPRAYIAPKSDGRIIVGATVEEMGFNRDMTAGGLYDLLRAAWETLPGVYELPIQEMWCGFRPGSRDNAPILGESAIPGVYMATGHYRNGILFAPATAVHMSSLILDGIVPNPLKPFSPLRFSA
jgi:glycine oxidase